MFHVYNVNDNVESDSIEEILKLTDLQHLNQENRVAIEKVLEKYADCFHVDEKELGKTDIITHKIPVVNDLPVYTKLYRLPHALEEELVRKLQIMMKNDMIGPPTSEYFSPIFLVNISHRA